MKRHCTSLQSRGALALYNGMCSFVGRHTSWMYRQLGKRQNPRRRILGQIDKILSTGLTVASSTKAWMSKSCIGRALGGSGGAVPQLPSDTMRPMRFGKSGLAWAFPTQV